MKQEIKKEVKKILETIERNNFSDISTIKKSLKNIYEKLVILEFLDNKINNLLSGKDSRGEVLTKNIEFEHSKIESTDSKVNTPSTNSDEPKNTFLRENKSIPAELFTSTHRYPDIKLGLNDRISFQKNLFNNNLVLLDDIIKKANQISSRDEMEKYSDELRREYSWTEDIKEYTDRFFEILIRKFDVKC